MSQEQKTIDDYPHRFELIMSTPAGFIGCATVGADSLEKCAIGFHKEYPKVVFTIRQIQ